MGIYAGRPGDAVGVPFHDENGEQGVLSLDMVEKFARAAHGVEVGAPIQVYAWMPPAPKQLVAESGGAMAPHPPQTRPRSHHSHSQSFTHA